MRRPVVLDASPRRSGDHTVYVVDHVAGRAARWSGRLPGAVVLVAAVAGLVALMPVVLVVGVVAALAMTLGAAVIAHRRPTTETVRGRTARYGDAHVTIFAARRGAVGTP